MKRLGNNFALLAARLRQTILMFALQRRQSRRRGGDTARHPAPNGTLSIGTTPPLTADMPPERSFEFPDPHFVARYVPCTTGCQEPKVPKEPKRASFSLKAKESIHTTVQEQLLRTPS